MWASSAAPIISRVCGVSGTCRVTKSDTASSSRSAGTERLLPIGSRAAMSKNTTCMPIISASTPTWRPMWP
jgi:hypothetical protein